MNDALLKNAKFFWHMRCQFAAAFLGGEPAAWYRKLQLRKKSNT
jgi:hypothetical protein